MTWLRRIFMLLILSSGPAWSADLGLFAPIIFETKQLQEALQADPVLGKYDIRIFQKFDDFLVASELKKFDIAILPGSYERFYNDYKPVITLTGDQPKLKHMVVSFKKTLPENFSIAVIDEVGRKNLKKWLEQVCKKCKKQKDVKKAKDLYAMLALGSTDSILVSSLNMSKIKEESGAELEVVWTAEEDKYPAIYVPSDKPAPKLSGISKKTFSILQLSLGEVSK